MPCPLDRRQFLSVSAMSAASTICGTSASASAAASVPRVRSVIFINLIGGPSQLDTWDPKPNAPSEVRSPFNTISTSVPGIHFTELFPKLAQQAHRLTLLRGMHHTVAPIHELGLQLLNTGRTFHEQPSPSLGALATEHLGERDFVTAWCHLGSLKVDAGLNVDIGQGVSPREAADFPRIEVPGNHDFATLMKLAALAVKTGVRFVCVNQFASVFDQPSWDCHADFGSLACDLGDYRDTIAPSFDHGFSLLLDELAATGLLSETLVVASGEFGRTPRRNSNGGRDHWAGCWTALVAGGGTAGGRVIGASDATASEPKDRPTTPQELFATMGLALGLPVTLRCHGEPVFTASPIRELW